MTEKTYKAVDGFVVSMDGKTGLMMSHREMARAVAFMLNEIQHMLKEQHRNDDADTSP